MALSRIVILVTLAALLAVPVLFRQEDHSRATSESARRVIIITPHNEQIRYEFAIAFNRWHEREYGESASVIWSVPGGTSEIRRMLESQVARALEQGRDPGGDADIVFGGGSFEHAMLKRGVRSTRGASTSSFDDKAWEPISQPVDFSDEWLDAIYGPNLVGNSTLYDPDKFWFGTALSGFGIVYNRDTLRNLGVDEPTSWVHLCDPLLLGWIALVNPGQSGSITTAFDTILQRHGWMRGWQILRRAGANARYFSAAAGKVPRDVSYGNAAMGVCIDFFGRFQSQAIFNSGGVERLGYIDPPGATSIDADPVSMLRGAPNPEVARRFIEFTVSVEAQALWQFRVGDTSNDDLGPRRFELRRFPIRRHMYADYLDRMIDQVDPYTIAVEIDANPSVRPFIAPLFSAMVMDTHQELVRAWNAIVSHPSYPRREAFSQSTVVTVHDVADPNLREMLRLFDAMPEIEGPYDQRYDLGRVHNLPAVENGWLRAGWGGLGLWHPEASPADEMRRRFAAFFEGNYLRIIEMADSGG